MNSNAHALPLLGLIKIAGFEPAGMRLKISPKVPEYIEPWRINLPLIKAEMVEGKIRAEYNGIEGCDFPSPEIEE